MQKKIIFGAFFFFFLAAAFASHSVSFAYFGYFVDKLQLPIGTKGQVWAIPRSVFEGPFHTNGQLRIDLPPEYFDEYSQPFFRGPVEASGIEYYKNIGPFDSAGQVDPQKFKMIFSGKVTLDAKQVALPDDPAEAARTAAYGTPSVGRLVDTDIVFIPHDSKDHLNGGIIVSRNLQSMTFVETQGAFQISLEEADGKTWVVAINSKKNETTLRKPDQSIVQYTGIPNGAIYAAGDIGSRKKGGIHGIVDGRWTVACAGDVYISGSLEYADTPEGSSPQGSDVLALISRNVFITNDAPGILYLYATIFAAQKTSRGMTGVLFVLPSADRDSARLGVMMWWGNYIGEYPAIMGTFDRSTGEAKDGYDLQKHYDSRLADNPPPFFPTVEDAAIVEPHYIEKP